MKRFHKPKSGMVKSPPGKVVSRRTDQRAWVFKGSRVPPRALFGALADGKSIGEFVKRFPNLRAEEIKNVLRDVGLLVDYHDAEWDDFCTDQQMRQNPWLKTQTD